VTAEAALHPGSLLGGRVRHAQFATGHRTGIEPVLLAASVPARPGERVLEGGTASGAALLCLAARVPGISGVGVEHDPAQAELARANVAANGFPALSILAADIEAGGWEGAFDHAFANPPWHDAAGTASPDAGRERARRATPKLFALWARQLAAPLRHRGTLTFVVAAGAVPDCLTAFAVAGCGSLGVLPLWPRAWVAAKIVLVRGVKGGRAPFRLLPGFILHGPDDHFTPDAEAILRDGAALPAEWSAG
jgi:tRNA1(Val) A37 N6-methylase TrmN6